MPVLVTEQVLAEEMTAGVARWHLDDLAGPGGGVGAVIVAVVLLVLDDHVGFSAGELRWFIPVSMAAGALVGAAMPAFARIAPVPAAGGGATVLALVGTYLCVPETDQFRTVYWLPLGVLALELLVFRPLHPMWYGAAAVPILWAGMYGMTDRFSAIAGVMFAWWAFVMVPLVSVFRPLRPASRTSLAVVALGMFAALVGVRTGGIVDDRNASIVLLLFVAVGSVAAGAVVAAVGQTIEARHSR